MLITPTVANYPVIAFFVVSAVTHNAHSVVDGSRGKRLDDSSRVRNEGFSGDTDADGAIEGNFLHNLLDSWLAPLFIVVYPVPRVIFPCKAIARTGRRVAVAALYFNVWWLMVCYLRISAACLEDFGNVSQVIRSSIW